MASFLTLAHYLLVQHLKWVCVFPLPFDPASQLLLLILRPTFSTFCVSPPVGSQTTRPGKPWYPRSLSQVPVMLHKYAKPFAVGRQRAIALSYCFLSEMNGCIFLLYDNT